jgi:rod shape-determining protein MreC
MSVTAPIQSTVTNIVSPVKDGWDYLVHFGQLTRENRELREQLSELRSEVSDLKSLKGENARLRKLVDLKKAKPFKITTARVIGMPSNNWWSSVVIDKGIQDGIKTGMSAIAGGGLVGQVADVSQHSAKIVLINDTDSGVSVQVQRTGEVGVIRGQLKSTKLTLSYVSRDSTIR